MPWGDIEHPIGGEGGGEGSPAAGAPAYVVTIAAHDGAGGYGAEVAAPWLSAKWDVLQPAGDLPTARCRVQLYSGMAINTTPEGSATLVQIEAALPDDALVTIRTDAEEPGDNECLFQGFVQRVRRSAAGGQYQAEVELIDRLDAVARGGPKTSPAAAETHSAIAYSFYGQFWCKRTGLAALLADPVEAIVPRLVDSHETPCVFNPDGRGNCHAVMARFEEAEAPFGWGETIRLPLFTYERDVHARRWNWARVLLYVIARLRITEAGTVRPPPIGLHFRNLIDNLIVAADYDDGDDVSALEPVEQLLTRAPKSFSLQGRNWVEALAWTCANAGLLPVKEVYVDDADGTIRHAIRFEVPGSGRTTPIKLAGPGFRSDDKAWADVLAATQVEGFSIERSFDACVNEARLIGGAITCEVTVGLVPLWVYDAARSPQVDVDPGNSTAVSAAIAAITSSGWGKYVRGGERSLASFNDADNALVLRHWGVPDAPVRGEADPATGGFKSAFARPWGPWQAAAYALYDWAAVEHGETGGPAGPFSGADMVARPRPLRECCTSLDGGKRLPPLVEWSADSGTTWRALNASVRIAASRPAIYLEQEDLQSLVAPGGETFAGAYIRGTLRLRVTASIAGDKADRPGDLAESDLTLSRRRRGRLLLQPEDAAYEIRDDVGGTSGGNSIFQGDATKPAVERLDLDALDRLTLAVERGDRVKMAGTLQLPRIRVPADSLASADLRVGEEVSGFEAQVGADAVHSLSFESRADDAAGATIVAVRYRFALGDDETPPIALTELVLDDASRYVRLGV